MRMRRWLMVVAVMLGVGAMLPSLAEASETITITVGPNPTAGVPLPITVSGASEVAGQHLVVNLQHEKCAEAGWSWESASARPLGSTAVSTGGFLENYSVTPVKRGSLAVCAYLVSSVNLTEEEDPFATGSDLVQVAPVPLNALTVTVRSRPGKTAARPGRTELLVDAAGEAEMHLMLKRRGQAQEDANSGIASSHTFLVPWSCRRPAAVYAWTITAHNAPGVTLTRSGSFRVPLSAARCRVLKTTKEREHRTEVRLRREEREEDAAAKREGERAEKAQREDCERTLGGHVQEQTLGEVGNGAPANLNEVETICFASGRFIRLQGDPPRVVAVG